MLIDMFGFFMWIAYGVTMMTIFVFRKIQPDAYRPFRVSRFFEINLSNLCGCTYFSWGKNL